MESAKGQIVAQKIPSVSDSRLATVAGSATVGVPASESDCSLPSPSRSETSDEVLRKAQLDLNRRDSGLTCMGWAPGARLAASVGSFNNKNPNAKVLTRDESGVWKTVLPNKTASSTPTPHDSVDEANVFSHFQPNRRKSLRIPATKLFTTPSKLALCLRKLLQWRKFSSNSSVLKKI
ncbi:hypothetical protein Nepgr_018875 [Nepenthes gracilis]|uniref:Glycoside hydrolase family 13 N-terminal domain-containing protein n=1 Tax=Nepenthes gracilis TaxID=150966 RepID=A0AAD3SU74_NEPGR|nr:hypothetical protein Nepgr_018875 [Nepenthes gracilis]